MNLYDTHCHIDLLPDKKAIMEEINQGHIYVMAMTNLPDIYRREKVVYDSKYIRTCLGFHPELIEEYEHQVEMMWQLLPTAKYIGEVGLDFVNAGAVGKQVSFLSELFERCNDLSPKIISLHSRGAVDELLNILPEKRTFIPIMHWYTGTAAQLCKAVKLGCYISVNFSMLRSSKSRQLIKNIPEDRLLIETDAPFALKMGSYTKTLEEINNQLSMLLGIENEKLFVNFKTLLESNVIR